MSTHDRFKLMPVAYLVLRRDNEVLLLRRANTGYQDGKYSVVAGHLEYNELATDGMAREAKEEAGIKIDPGTLRLVHVAYRLNRDDEPSQERIDLFFETREWEGKITNAEPEKCDDLSWFPVDNLPDNVLPFVRSVIDNLGKGLVYSEYTEQPV